MDLCREREARELAAFRLSETGLARIQQLMVKHKDSALTSGAGRELDRLTLLDDVIGLILAQLPDDHVAHVTGNT